jgi:reverse gyrase
LTTELPPSVYLSSCPNCGGEISSFRLAKGSVCSNCLKSEREFTSVFDLVSALKANGNLNRLKTFDEIGRRFQRVAEFFRNSLGFPPLGPQRSWVLRVLKGESFAIVAPPGLGKTTFGLIMAAYFASEEGVKSVIVFPTKTIVQQGVERLQLIAERTKASFNLVHYHAGLSESQKEEALNALKSGSFDVFLTTTRFMTTNVELLRKVGYHFLFVDDVDAALKASKSARAILEIAGFTEDDIKDVKELLKQARTDETVYDKIAELRKKRLSGKIVVFSSATITRGSPTVSSLMGFKPGGAVVYLRNVIDAYLRMPGSEEEADELLLKLAKRLGDGILVFVPVDKGQKKGKQLAELLQDNGIPSEFIASESTRKIGAFTTGELKALVGSAFHYGLLVRGLDIPWRVKYAIFYGIPKFKFRIGETPPPFLVSRILSVLATVKQDKELARLAGRIRKRLMAMSPSGVAMLYNEIKEGKLEDETFKRAYEVVGETLKDEATLKVVAEKGNIIIEGDSILAPDFLTYIQASGRTSRIYAGSLTTGLSILMVDHDALFQSLTWRLGLVLEQVDWKPFDLDSWTIGGSSADEIIGKIERERNEIIKARKESTEPQLEKIKTITFIVESPTKAKTISGFFSKPSVRDLGGLRVYETVIENGVLNVVASQGHVYDLTTEERGFHGVEIERNGGVKYVPYYATIKRCANGHQLTQTVEGKCPICGSPIVRDKTRTVEALRDLVVESDLVLIGTDPDTEGEKIAWDLYLALRPFNPNLRRAEFHEVTRKAIINAINNPRDFNLNLIEAQIVRRIEDRWIGFILSRKLQTEFWRDYCRKKRLDEKGYSCDENRNLSAGRVQTPVLGWVVRRYEDINRTKRRVYTAEIRGLEGFYVLIPRDKDRGINKRSSLVIKFLRLDTKTEVQNPLPPYTTDALLADAAQLYKLTASETMRIAQDLFESGLITYHRTDSTRISSAGIGVAESYLKDALGEDYKKLFVPRTWGEGGAHEAIRPTKPLDVDKLRLAIEEAEINPPVQFRREHFLVYDLIFRRFITSQLAPMELTFEVLEYKVYDEEGNEVKLDCDSDNKADCNRTERVVDFSFKGFGKLSQDLQDLMVYTPFRLQRPVIPQLKELCGSDECSFELQIVKSFQKSDFRLYSEGELVSEMRRKEIGRPSTYATIISTLKKRGYVIESKSKKWLIPTPLGTAVYEFLSPKDDSGLSEVRKKIKELVSEARTVSLLKKMDEIEQGARYYVDVLNEVYEEISKVI